MIHVYTMMVYVNNKEIGNIQKYAICENKETNKLLIMSEEFSSLIELVYYFNKFPILNDQTLEFPMVSETSTTRTNTTATTTSTSGQSNRQTQLIDDINNLKIENMHDVVSEGSFSLKDIKLSMLSFKLVSVYTGKFRIR